MTSNSISGQTPRYIHVFPLPKAAARYRVGEIISQKDVELIVYAESVASLDALISGYKI
jgi:hypothetical protein